MSVLLLNVNDRLLIEHQAVPLLIMDSSSRRSTALTDTKGSYMSLESTFCLLRRHESMSSRNDDVAMRHGFERSIEAQYGSLHQPALDRCQLTTLYAIMKVVLA